MDDNKVDENKAQIVANTVDNEECNEKRKGSSLNLTSLFSEHNSTNTNLYVCNIPETWNIKELESLFGQHGKVISCRIMYDKYTGQSRRIGFVKFETRKQSDEALKYLNGKITKSSDNNSGSQSDKGLVVKYANSSNYLTILTSIAADIAAVHGINPNEILSYISQLYFPLGNAVPHVCKQRSKNLPEIIESKLKSYFGCENAELLKNEIKSCAKENLENFSSSIPTIRVFQNQSMPVYNNQNADRNIYVQGSIKKHNSNTNQPIYASKMEIPLNKIPSYQAYVPVKQVAIPQQFTKPLAKTGWPIFVYNLPSKCDECLLWKLFNPFGPVLYVHVNRDNITNKCKGYGIVTMTNYEQAINSIYVLNGLNLPGSNKPLHVALKMNNQ